MLRIIIFLNILFSFLAVAKTYNIAVVFRYEDKFNGSVANLDKGIELAVKLFMNKNKKIPIKVKKYSHGDEIEDVARVAKVILQDKPDLVMGGEMSVESLLLGGMLNEEKIVFVTPTSTNPQVTKDRPYVFRICFSDEQVGENLAAYVAKNMKVKVLGVFHNVSAPYSNYLTEAFVKNIRKLRPELKIVHEKVVSKEINLKPIIDKFKSNKVTHVAMLTYLSDLVMFYGDAVRESFWPVYVGSDGWGSSEGIIEKLTTRFDKKFIGFRNTYWDSAADTPFSRMFVYEYKNTYKENPNAWAAIGFDTAWISLSAIHLYDSKKSKTLKEAFHDLRNISLVTSKKFEFIKNNSPDKELFIERLSSEGVRQMGAFK